MQIAELSKLVVSVPCLTYPIAMTFTALARRGTQLTLQFSVESSIIYTFRNYKIFFVLGKHRSLEMPKKSLQQRLDLVIIKSYNILTRVLRNECGA